MRHVRIKKQNQERLAKFAKAMGHSTRIAILHMFPQLFYDCYPS